MSAALDWNAGWTADHFAAFFQAVHGQQPFPWQGRLAARLLDGGGWPGQLDLPTAVGKTAALDIAVFHLAAELHRGGVRTAPVRIAFVVDRRLIVDDSYARAVRIARALVEPDRDDQGEMRAPELAACIRPVADQLTKLARMAEQPALPLLVRRLRGGVPREDDWARTPAQPTILTSTVDQVGSRLLFRGYGVSDRMAPVHAGLIGSDCLILLDEAHLSRPFEQTLDAVVRLGRGERTMHPLQLQHAVMTATPATAAESSFALDDADGKHDVLRSRLARPKPAILAEIKPSKGGEEDGDRGPDAARRRTVERDRVDAVVKQVRAALMHLGGVGSRRDGAPPVIGVVVNRVLRARAVYEALAAEYDVPVDGPAPNGLALSLVIGPARSADRDRLAELDLAPLKTGRTAARAGLAGPAVVVATQTIEAGVDLDFDALVTELAALDALRQRFGRLNRAGRDITPYAAILAHPKDDLKPGRDGDPIYGLAAARTWQCLSGWASDGTVDLAHSSLSPRLAVLSDGDRAALLTPKADAPVVMPAYIDLWSRTAPAPAADPEAALFLHGPARAGANVSIVWRADLTDKTLERAETVLETAPIRAAETVEVPLWAARSWMSGGRPSAADFADAPERSDGEAAWRAGRRRLFRVERDRGKVLANPAELKPGDLLLAPAAYGGCDRFGWAPQSTAPVTDLGEVAAWPYRKSRYAVRLSPDRLVAAMLAEAGAAPGTPEEAKLREVAASRWSTLADQLAELSDAGDQVKALLSAPLPASLQQLLAPLGHARGRSRDRRFEVLAAYADEGAADPYAAGIVAVARFGVAGTAALMPEDGPGSAADPVQATGIPATEDDATGSLDQVEVSLLTHSKDVECKAAGFAAACGLPEEMAGDIALAGWLHDAGKADPRIQAFLGSGDPLMLDQQAVLAKSGRRSTRGAWARAGLPDNWRHEALSVRLALANPRLRDAADPGLVLWLVGTHHGCGRPLFPHMDPLDGQGRALPYLDGLAAPLGPGRGPQSLGFSFEGDPFDEALLGLDWAQLFEALKGRYGVWGLAYLEAVVRLADHRASETHKVFGLQSGEPA